MELILLCFIVGNYLPYTHRKTCKDSTIHLTLSVRHCLASLSLEYGQHTNQSVPQPPYFSNNVSWHQPSIVATSPSRREVQLRTTEVRRPLFNDIQPGGSFCEALSIFKVWDLIPNPKFTLGFPTVWVRSTAPQYPWGSFAKWMGG